MRRAIRLLSVIALAAVTAVPVTRADDQVMNGIGLIDYGRRPDFKVGTWVKYHVTGQSAKGRSDEYDLTIGIAGEERFWGEDCFWVETLQSGKGGSSLIATLMSYSVYDDSLPFTHIQYYTRKNILDTDAMGVPQEDIARRPAATLRSRLATAGKNLSVHFDTLGTDTLTVPKGTYLARHVRIKQDLGVEMDIGDSTVRSDNYDDRDSYISRKVPLTGIVREDIEFRSTKKTWMVGRSSEAPTVTAAHSTGRAVLLDFGENYKGSLVPEARRRSLREQDREAAAREAPPRRASPKKPG